MAVRHKNGLAASDPSSPVNTRVLGRLCEEKKSFKSAFLTTTTTSTERKEGGNVCKKFSVNIMFACTRFRPTGWGGGITSPPFYEYFLSLHGNSCLSGEVSLFGIMLAEWFSRCLCGASACNK